MIRSNAEYEGAQRELRYLKEFLSQAEAAPDHPNRELGIISIYKRMYHLWEELEELKELEEVALVWLVPLDVARGQRSQVQPLDRAISGRIGPRSCRE
jgi:hypothetical protein